MRIKKNMIIILIFGIFAFFLYHSNMDKNQEIRYPTDGYLIATSYMTGDKSNIVSIDKSSRVLDSVDVKATDLSFVSYNENKLIISGQRSNDNLILDETGNIEKIHLWKEENRTGSTAIKVKDKKIYALMNVGYVDSIYRNRLIIQDKKGNIYDEVYLNISGANIFIKDNLVFITGSEANSKEGTWHGKILIYDHVKKKIINEYVDSAYSEFSDIYLDDGNLIFIAKKLNIDEDCILRSNIELKDMQIFYQGKRLAGLHIRDGRVFVVDNNKLIGFDLNEPHELTENIDLIESGYYSNSIMSKNRLIILMRNQDKLYENGKVNIGKILEFDSDLNMVNTTDLIVPEHVNADTFLVLPNF